MPCTLERLLALALGDLPEALASAEARERLERVRTGLPAVFSWVGLECRLDADPRVDLAGSIDARGGGRDALARALEGGALDESLGPIEPLARAWCAADDPLHDAPQLWVELDMDAEAPRFPFAFVTLLGLSPGAVDAAISRTLELFGERSDPVARCVSALPAGSVVHHVAALSPRGRPGVRLVVRAPTSGLFEYLRRIDWPGDPAPLTPYVDLLGSFSSDMVVDLDVVDAPADYLGIEIHYRSNPLRDPRWGRVFELVESAGLAEPAKLIALARYLGEAPPGQTRDIHLKACFREGAWRVKGYAGLRR